MTTSMPALETVNCTRQPLGGDETEALYQFHYGQYQREADCVTVRVARAGYGQPGYKVEISSFSHRDGNAGDAFKWAVLWQTAAYTAQSLEAQLK